VIFTTNAEPYLDVVNYHFDANTNMLSWQDLKYSYPNSTDTADDATVALILENQLHYIPSLTYSVDPIVGPETEAMFNTVWEEMQGDSGGAMRFIPGCDLNGDGVCDSRDESILSNALGTCSGQSGYIPRIDVDGDGCITTTDVAAFQTSIAVCSQGGCQVCSTDLTSQVTITRSGYTYNFATGRFSQTVTIKNTGASPISGPFSLVLDNLASNATLFNASGKTTCAAPSGNPYINVSTTRLNSGASVTFVLQFANPSKAAINYSASVLGGSGVR
jgi:hypothetical protein